jgi:hypothetical protein
MMLNEYRMKNRKLEVEAVDMQSEPELAQQYNIRIPGSVLLLSGPKTRVLTPEDYIKMEMVGQRPRQVANYEEAITAALIALTRREQFTVYFTIGHDERDTNRAENDGASLLKEALVQDGFLVKATNLLLSGTVPADCDLLVMAGPRGAISSQVVSNVEAYLMQGKPAIFLTEHDAPAFYRAMLERWGVKVTGEVVIDPERLYMNSLINIPNYSFHEITKDLAEGQRFTGLVFAAALEKSAAALDGKAAEAGLFDIKPLLTSGEKAWGERGSLAEGQQLRRDAGEREGKFDMAFAVIRKAAVVSADTNGQAVVTHPGPQQDLRMVVIGDADLIGNGFFSTFPGNRDLLLNSANWALGQEKNITIRPKGAVDYRLTLTETQNNIIKIVSIVLLPLAVVIPGLFVYLRRRRNG